MSLAFTSSLFGLSGSLVLGFLDLQAGQAQSRFYTELEDRLSADLEAAGAPQGAQQDSTEALEGLATGVQALVRHMRQEQQMIRDWVEAQAERQARLQAVVEAHLAGEKPERR
jgi:hypothetical protein